MTRFEKGTIKRVHVDRRIMAANLKHGENNPPITVQTGHGPYKAREVRIEGPSTFVYRPEKPLACGARLWVETRGAVEFE